MEISFLFLFLFININQNKNLHQILSTIRQKQNIYNAKTLVLQPKEL